MKLLLSVRFFKKIIALNAGLILFHGSINAQTQPLRFSRLVPGNDENHNTIICMIQDRAGFMWFGTKKGVLRYDGYQFRHYKHSVIDSTSIGGDFVRAMAQDRDGNLWIGIENGGLNRFNHTHKTFIKIPISETDSSAGTPESVYSMEYDSSGVLWLGTQSGLRRYHISSGMTQRIDLAPVNTRIMSIKKGRPGELWIATWNNGVYRYETGGNKLTSVPFSNTRQDALIWSVYPDQRGRIWLCTFSNGLQILDSAANRFVHYVPVNHAHAERLNRSNVFSVFEDGHGRIWIGKYQGGMDILNTYSGELQTFRYNPSENTGVASDIILCFYQDRTGIIWVGTYGEGLSLYHPLMYRFHDYNRRNLPLKSDEIVDAIGGYSIHDLWLVLNTGFLVPFEKEATRPIKLTSPDEVVAFSYYENKQTIWWTSSKALYDFNPQSGKIKRYPMPEGKFPTLDYIGRYDSVRLLIGTFDHPLIFDKRSKQFSGIEDTDSNLAVLNKQRILSYLNDSDTLRWFGINRGGLYRYNTRTRTLKHYSKASVHSARLSNDVILYLYKDRCHYLWIGTEGGLNALNTGNDSVTIYREEQGLLNDIVYTIVEDGRENLWMSTPRGISRFSRKNRTFRNYDEQDGLPASAPKYNSSARLSGSGEIIVGNRGGFVVFHPDSIRENEFPPPVRLTSIKKFNREFITDTPVEMMDHVELSHQDYVVSFEFTALSYMNSQKNQYAYRLEGFDDAWTYTKNRSVTYTNLSPGNYTLHIRASNNDGVWNEDGYRLAIYVSPPFYRTWWFMSGAVLALFAGVVAVHKFRVRTIKQQKAALENQVSERTREILRQKTDIEIANRQITEQKNDLERVNCQLSDTLNQLQVKESELIHAEKMSALGDLVAGMTHEINNPVTFVIGNMDYLDHEFKRTFASEIPEAPAPQQLVEWKKAIHASMVGAKRVKDIIANLKNFSKLDEADFKEIFIHRDLDIIINLFFSHIPHIIIEKRFDPRLDKEPFGCYARELNLCFRNIMVNAVQAIRDAEKANLYEAGAGKILILTKKTGLAVTITFRDNGIGIPKKIQEKIFLPFFTTRDIGEGRGLGLSETYGIIRKHQGHIDVTSEHHKGAEITLILPLHSTK